MVDIRDLRSTPQPYGAGGSEIARVGADTIAHSVSEDGYGQQRDHWIITFDDPPG